MAQKKQPAAQKKQPKPEVAIEQLLIRTKVGIKFIRAKKSFTVKERVLVLHQTLFDVENEKRAHYTVSDYLTGMMVANGFGKEKVIAEAKAKARKHNIGDLARKQKLPEINQSAFQHMFLVTMGQLKITHNAILSKSVKDMAIKMQAFLTAVKQFSETNPPKNGN